MSGLGAFASGLSSGLSSGVGLGRAAATTDAIREETAYRKLKADRERREMEDQDYIRSKQSEAVKQAKFDGKDDDEAALFALDVGQQAANERNRYDIASGFHATKEAATRGLVGKYLDSAIRTSDPAFVGKAMTVLTRKKTAATADADGSITLDDGSGPQKINAKEVSGWLQMVRDPNAWMRLRAELAKEAREQAGKERIEVVKGEQQRKTELVKTQGDIARDAAKPRDPRENYVTLKNDDGGEYLVDVRTGRQAAGNSGQSGPGPKYVFDEKDRPYQEQFGKDALRDFGTEGGADPDNPFGAKRVTDPDGVAARVASNAMKILKGSAIGKGKYLLEPKDAYRVARDVEKKVAVIRPDAIFEDANGQFWQAPAAYYGEDQEPIRLGGGVPKNANEKAKDIAQNKRELKRAPAAKPKQQEKAQESPIDRSRPIIENKDGSFSTEKTISVEADGKHYLIPTIVNGKQLSNEDAVRAWRNGSNKEVGVFGSEALAKKAAIARSQRIGNVRALDRGLGRIGATGEW